MLNIQYRSNLISVINEIESINLTKAHNVYLQKTPFWKLIFSILNHNIIKDYVRKSDVDVEKIIQTFDRQNKCFNLGGKKIRISETEVRTMFGIEHGQQLIDSTKKTNRPKTEFVSRRFHGLVRVKKQNISEALRQAAEEETEIGREDVARLLTLFCLATLFVPNKGHSLSWYYIALVDNLDQMHQYNWSQHILEYLENNLCSASKNTSIAGCVMMLPYWICEHTTLVQQAQQTGTPRCLVWDLKPLCDALKKNNLKNLNPNQVIQDEHDNNDDDDDVERSWTDNSIIGSETAGMIDDDLLISDILEQMKSNVAHLKKTNQSVSGTAIEDTNETSEHDKSGTVPETVPEPVGGTIPTTVPEKLQETQEASPSIPVQQPTDTTALVLTSLNHERIEELEQQIKEKDEKIAELEKQLTEKDEALTKFYLDNEDLNLQNAKLKADLANVNAVVELLKNKLVESGVHQLTQKHAATEALKTEIVESRVHEITQEAKASVTKQQQTTTANEPSSTYKRLKERKRQKKRDPHYTYSGKKRAAKKQRADTTAVDPKYTESDIIDVELLEQLSKHESEMPKQPSLKQIISLFQQNAHLSASENERILKLVDNEGQADKEKNVMEETEQVKEEMPYNDGVVDVSRSVRDVQPAHYLFKISSFSILLEEIDEKYESGDFEAGGYKWGLCLYPNGNKKSNGKGHISLYLVIRDTDNLPPGWEVNVQFKLFVFDQIRDSYLSIQDAGGKIRRFHGMKTECGFAQLLSLDSFNDTSNGYLVEDSCVFGAEVFVVKCAGKGECVSFIKQPKNNTFTWKVQNFSSISQNPLSSEEFKVEEQYWKLSLYPDGNGKSVGESLSLFLCRAGSSNLPLDLKHYAKYNLQIKDQVLGRHHEKQASCWFSASFTDWGYADFIKLCDLNDTSKGYLVKDTLIVEVEIMVMSVVTRFP